MTRAMHRKYGFAISQANNQMAALSRLERTALLLQPSLELPACHKFNVQQMCCLINRFVALI